MTGCPDSARPEQDLIKNRMKCSEINGTGKRRSLCKALLHRKCRFSGKCNHQNLFGSDLFLMNQPEDSLRNSKRLAGAGTRQ